jgi:hypothetical protein
MIHDNWGPLPETHHYHCLENGTSPEGFFDGKETLTLIYTPPVLLDADNCYNLLSKKMSTHIS